MVGDPQNVPIVPIFVPMLFQNGCSIHSNRAQLRLSARRLKIAALHHKKVRRLAVL
jgi:hypothetical protein